MIGALTYGSDEITGRVWASCLITPSATTPLLPQSRLRKRPLVSFWTEPLKTGDCLVRLGWGQRTFHITFENYELLRDTLPPIGAPIHKKEKISDDLLATPLEEQREQSYAECAQIDRITSLPADVKFWAVSPVEVYENAPHGARFDPVRFKLIAQIGMPAAPQPPPQPLQWDASVIDPPTLLPQAYYSWSIDVPKEMLPPPCWSDFFVEWTRKDFDEKRIASDFLIMSCERRKLYLPLLKLTRLWDLLASKSKAKGKEKLAQNRNEMLEAAALLRHLSDGWRKDVPYNGRQSESVTPNETPLHCPRCGSGIMDKNLNCQDCRQSMRKFIREKESRDAELERALKKPKRKTDLTHCNIVDLPIGRRKRVRMSQEEFVAALVQSNPYVMGQLLNPKKLKQAAATMRLLTSEIDIMSKDLAEENDEPINSIDSRVTRVLRAARVLDRLDTGPTKTVKQCLEIALLAVTHEEIFRRVAPQFGGDFMKLLDFLLQDVRG